MNNVIKIQHNNSELAVRQPFFFRLFKKPFFGRFQKEWRWPSGYIERSSWEPVKFISMTHSIISGLYGPAIKMKPKGTIVCCHPMGTMAKGFFLKNGIADRFRIEGYNILLFDFNGFGESTDGNFYLNKDILAAGLYAKEKDSSLPVGLYGISFGAAMALCAFSKINNPYKAAVLESPFTTLAEYWSKFPIPSMVLKTGSTILPWKEREVRPIYHAERIKNTTDILWIYSDTDTDTPLDMGRRFMETCNINSQLMVIPGAKHAYCYEQDKDTFFYAAKTFFNRHL